MEGPGFETVIAPDPEALYERSAAYVADYLSGLRENERISIALAGGSTPAGLHEKLAAEPHRSNIPWERIHLFWGDERFVPPDDPGSNYRMARESLIEVVPIPPENIHRIPGEAASPEAAAQQYEEALKNFFGPSSEWPAFELIILGIGTDGHTASLFPGSPALEEKTRWVVAARAPVEPRHRITLTLPAINHASRIFFLASGTSKAPVLKDRLGGNSVPEKYPYQRVRPAGSNPVLFLDRKAAGT
ncbi:MAG TPA: 6-phosphogluconolactonase [Nitrospiria bacterium]|nr:6-phosphogluconolactonase [Nitrospiria bacterium]